MKIKIIAVELSSATDKKGKPYQIVEVSYKNLTFQGKVESRKLMPFGGTVETNKLFSKAAANEFYEVEVVKNAAGFNEWVSANKVEDEPETASTASQTTPIRSTYETPEERAKKQVYIVRQSSLTSAMTYHDLTKTKNVSIDLILATAKEFENYVFGIVGKPIVTSPLASVTSLADMEDDIPY
jgi:acyl-CoA thioesterase